MTAIIATWTDGMPKWPGEADQRKEVTLFPICSARLARMQMDETYRQALRHHRAGQFAQAESLYRQVIASLPAHHAALHMLGCILHQTGRTPAGIELLRHAISLDSRIAEYHCHLGLALMSFGAAEESRKEFADAVKLRDDYAEAWFYLGTLLCSTGQARQAADALRKCVASGSTSSQAYQNFGIALTLTGEADEAVAACRQAIKLRPDAAEGYLALGNALQAQGRHEDSAAAYQEALRLKPEMEQAKAALAFVQLRAGDFANGWSGMDARLKCLKQILGPALPQPLWDGSPLQNRRILLRGEQGYGDTIQFVRFLPQVAARGGRLLVQCQPELHRLLRGQLGIERLVARGDRPADFDLQYPLMSLAGLFGTTLETIPDVVPYLSVDAARSQYWKLRLGQLPHRINVALAWAGRPTHKDDQNRSIALESFGSVREISNVNFISLQKGPAAIQAQTPPRGMRLIDWTEELTDFAETAALLANLDLVITVDTAVAHLAGALGKEVWVLLPSLPDWRWMMDRENSPWYPTMRLFRAPAPKAWQRVMQRVAGELATKARGG